MSSTIAVDASPVVRPNRTGTEVYAREVLCRLPRLAPDLVWTFYAPAAGSDGGLDLTLLPFPLLRTQVRLPIELLRARPALLFSPGHQLPLWCPVPALTVFHGLEFRRYPQAYSRVQRAALNAGLQLARRHCRRLITVSEASRRDLVELAGFPPEQVVVVYPGGGDAPAAGDPERDAQTLAALGVPTPYVIHVGRVEARKNQLTALRAVEQVPDLALVSVGPDGDSELERVLRASNRCLRLGWVPREQRDALYRGAAALLFPSLYEGFGFPVLEAMRLGTPVVTARNSSLEEVGGDAAIYVEDARDAGGFARALCQVIEDPGWAKELRQTGQARAAQFSWDTSAAGVVGVIRELL